MTAMRPDSRRFAAIVCSTANAASVAVWSFSSSLTSLRQKSDEMTSVGRKCRLANVDLPEPDTPTSATTLSSGMTSFIG